MSGASAVEKEFALLVDNRFLRGSLARMEALPLSDALHIERTSSMAWAEWVAHVPVAAARTLTLFAWPCIVPDCKSQDLRASSAGTAHLSRAEIEIVQPPSESLCPVSARLSEDPPNCRLVCDAHRPLDSATEIVQPPSEFLCPISARLFEDPVVTAAGQCYERTSIERWLEKHDTDPNTNIVLSSRTLTEVVVLRKLVEDWKRTHGAALLAIERQFAEMNCAVQIQKVWRSHYYRRLWFERSVSEAKSNLVAMITVLHHERCAVPAKLMASCNRALLCDYDDVEGYAYVWHPTAAPTVMMCVHALHVHSY